MRYSIREVRDIPYRDTGLYKHQLDAYIPMDDTKHKSDLAVGPKPVVVWAHGGGWKRFDRRDALSTSISTGRALARRGVLTYVISYRTSSLRWRDVLLA